MYTTLIDYINESKSNKKSLDSYKMVEILKKQPYVKYLDRPSGYYLQSIDLTIDNNHIDELKSLLKKYNWYLERGHDNLTVTKKYIEDSIISNIPEKLYHATPIKNIKSIMKYGLIPKSEDMRHKYPPRIYVSKNIYNLKSLIKELKSWKNTKDDYTIIEINTNGLSLELYKDLTSLYSDMYYIQENKIPKSNLKDLHFKL